MKFTDSHCHISKEHYDNINELINEAKDNNIFRCITSGYDQNSNEEVIEVVNSYNEIYGTIGIHPSEAPKAKDSWFDYIVNNIINKKIIAIGEIGLDYHYDGYDKEKQLYWFNKQLKLASENNIPVVIHSRDATEDTINTLKKYKLRGVIHSFTGSYETANIYIKMGFLLGINGTITFSNSKLKDTIKKLGIENIILETDCPYLTPAPNRGKTNYPKYIKNIADFISNYNDISLEKLSNITEKNIERVFDI